MNSPKIENIYHEYTELIGFFRDNSQISFENYINDTYKKSLLLSAASFFEFVVTSIIIDYSKSISSNDQKIVAFIQNKALERQYHTMFEWNANNANKFFALFGDELKAKARKVIDQKQLFEAERAFIEIGRDRNKLVHNNYIESPINNTFEEIYSKYNEGCKFLDFLKELVFE